MSCAGRVGASQLRSRAAAVEEVNFAERAPGSDRQGVEVSSISSALAWEAFVWWKYDGMRLCSTILHVAARVNQWRRSGGAATAYLTRGRSTTWSTDVSSSLSCSSVASAAAGQMCKTAEMLQIQAFLFRKVRLRDWAKPKDQRWYRAGHRPGYQTCKIYYYTYTISVPQRSPASVPGH